MYLLLLQRTVPRRCKSITLMPSQMVNTHAAWFISRDGKIRIVTIQVAGNKQAHSRIVYTYVRIIRISETYSNWLLPAEGLEDYFNDWNSYIICLIITLCILGPLWPPEPAQLSLETCGGWAQQHMPHVTCASWAHLGTYHSKTVNNVCV